MKLLDTITLNPQRTLIVPIPITKCELKEGSSPRPKVIVRARTKRFLLLIASEGFLQFS